MDVPQLIAELKSPTATARAAAAEQLAHLEDGAQAAAVDLVQAAADDDDSVRQWASGTLESLGPPAATDADKLAKLLADPRNDVAYWAATLLGRLGAAANESGESILPCSEIVTGLTAALTSHPEIPVRERAAWALGQIGPAAIAAVPALQNAAAAAGPRLSRLAKQAIEQISAKAE
jgi:HEAT repeat protein